MRVVTRQWEDVDHELEDSVAGALISPSGGTEGDGDPLGLGGTIKYVGSTSSTVAECLF